MKHIYCIRHGLAMHNVLYKKYGTPIFSDPHYVDTLLVPEGHKQSIQLGKTWTDINKIELVIVSPLKRTLDTAINIFQDKQVPIVALDESREYPLGLHTCNKRKYKEELEILYPTVDFSSLETNYDNLWNSKQYETIESLQKRIDNVLNYIQQVNETNIALINHSSFLSHMIHKHIPLLDNEEKELEHCQPYLFKL